MNGSPRQVGKQFEKKAGSIFLIYKELFQINKKTIKNIIEKSTTDRAKCSKARRIIND